MDNQPVELKLNEPICLRPLQIYEAFLHRLIKELLFFVSDSTHITMLIGYMTLAEKGCHR